MVATVTVHLRLTCSLLCDAYVAGCFKDLGLSGQPAVYHLPPVCLANSDIFFKIYFSIIPTSSCLHLGPSFVFLTLFCETANSLRSGTLVFLLCTLHH